ncbi:MAG: hypothetical protein AABX17_02435 [Nanoarchaeota archaeon]
MVSGVIYRGEISRGLVRLCRGFKESIILPSSEYEVLGKISGRKLETGIVLIRTAADIVKLAEQRFSDYNLIAFKYDMTTTGKIRDTLECGLVIKIISEDRLNRMEKEGITIL